MPEEIISGVLDKVQFSGGKAILIFTSYTPAEALQSALLAGRTVEITIAPTQGELPLVDGE